MGFNAEPPEFVVANGSHSLLCYWGDAGVRNDDRRELAKKLNLAQPTISQSVMRGRKIGEEEGLKILEQINQ